MVKFNRQFYFTMSEKFNDRYRIPSARLQKWDYGWNATYFITICTSGHDNYFGKITEGTIDLTEIGKMAQKYWLEIPYHFPFIKLDEFVVMPNHIHGILSISKKNTKDAFIDSDYQTETSTSNYDAPPAVETRHRLVSLPTQPNLHMQAETRRCLVSTVEQPFTYLDQNNKNATSTNPTNKLSPGQKRFRNQGKGTVSSILGSYKSIVSRNAHRLNSDFGWQARFYDNIVRSDVEYNTISNYIKTNPKRWNEDKFFK